MKITSNYYATALAEVLTSQKANRRPLVQTKKIVGNFLALLAKNGDEKKAKEIIILTEELLRKKAGNKKVVLQMARAVPQKSIVKYFSKKGDVVEVKINPKLIAGVKIIINDNRQIDFSLQKKLDQLFKV